MKFRDAYTILFFSVFFLAFFLLFASTSDAQGSALKYSRVFGDYRYCYYFSGAQIIVRKYESCPRYAP